LSVDNAPVLAAQKRWLAHRRDRDATASVTVGVAASFTAEPLEPFLGGRLLDAGEVPAFRFAGYNQLHQVCFDPHTMLGPVDVIVVLWRVEDVLAADLHRFLDTGDGSAASALVAGSAELGRAVADLAARAGRPVLASTPPALAPVGVDLVDSSVTVMLGRVHAACSNAFLDALEGSPARVVDLAAWERAAGADVHDLVKWVAYKQPYTGRFWLQLGGHLGDAIAREKTPPPKCVVLDADNTLWGGVIGEDGIGGIELSSAFPGIAFQEFQRVLKGLRHRGVLLAVASKNNHDDVVEVFTGHDDMVLSVDDIAVWRVNWGPKSQSLREIAVELNIGEDALVFVDDSHYELAEVRASLPHVRCLQVPEEVAELPALLPASGLFRNLQVSAEDLKRTEMILSQQARKDVGSGLSREQFLASLELVVEYFEVTEEHVGRVAQLTNKTNQFNLTTIRRTEADVRTLMGSPDHLLRAIRVSDRFGEYGLVGVAVLERSTGDDWVIETLLMSCRVLGRGIESTFIARLTDDAVAAGAKRIVGRHAPTQKNVIVADLYPRHGFTRESDGVFVAGPAEVALAPSHVAVA
jgi:FkbH-like protein